MENKKWTCCSKDDCSKEHREKKAERLKEPKYLIVCDEKMKPVKIKRVSLECGEVKKEKIHLKDGQNPTEKIEQRKKLYS